MTLMQIAEASGVNYAVVLKDARNGKIKAIKDDGRWKVIEEAYFIEWLHRKWNESRVEMYQPAIAVRRAYDFGYITPYHCGQCSRSRE